MRRPANAALVSSLAEDIDTTTSTDRLVFHVFASIAQFERKKISERTKEGLASARKRGRIGGRLSALTTVQKDEVRWMRDAESCGATLLVNMRDIEPRKEDDGFDGAFLSP